MAKSQRTCVACRSPLRREDLICSACGALAETDGASVRPCLRCEALVDADLLYCPRCGGLTVAVEGAGLAEARLKSLTADRITLDEILVDAVAGLAAIAALGALVWVLVD